METIANPKTQTLIHGFNLQTYTKIPGTSKQQSANPKNPEALNPQPSALNPTVPIVSIAVPFLGVPYRIVNINFKIASTQTRSRMETTVTVQFSGFGALGVSAYSRFLSCTLLPFLF